MERLTKRNGLGEAITNPHIRQNGYTRCLEKLAHYEDLEEQGRIVYLPCKVGDAVYRISKCSCWNSYECSVQTRKRCQGKINIRQCNRRKATCCVYVNKTEFRLKYVAEIGKTIFLTKEEAEQALAEMKKG